MARQSSALGQPTLVHCRHRNPSVPAKIYTTRNMIDDTAIHEIDTCRFLLDEEMTFNGVSELDVHVNLNIDKNTSRGLGDHDERVLQTLRSQGSIQHET
jgi:predicted dehydrogenase